MNGFIAFSKKELTEQFRSYKTIILAAVLFLFGMMSPLLAKITPEILSGMEIQGMVITIPEPTVLDAYGQFFKNVGQMGLVVLLLIFSGLLSQDVTKGTLIVLVAKGLSRSAVILSKFVTALLLWTVGYALAAATAYGYTVYLFGSGLVPNLFFALFCLWLFGALILSLLLLTSAIASGNYGGVLMTAGVLILLLIISGIPAVLKWNPVTLVSSSAGLIGGTSAKGDITAAVWLTILLIAACLIAAILIFRKKRL